jgi:hypothetical protein
LADRFQRIAQTAKLQEVYIPYAEKIVNDILELCCLNESQSRKLLDKQHLNISADGSKLKAHANPYGKKICIGESSSDSYNVPGSTIHLMLHGVTTPTGNASSLATISIRSIAMAGAQTTSMNSRPIS